jgi:hypothetical protein
MGAKTDGGTRCHPQLVFVAPGKKPNKYNQAP